jgi:hypothetical protein
MDRKNINSGFRKLRVLIASLQKKQKDEPWEDNFQAEPQIIYVIRF